MIKTMVAVWCNYTETQCIRRVTGDTQRQALDYARLNGWYISGHNHFCPFHKPKVKQ
jgi:hypothetical protein